MNVSKAIKRIISMVYVKNAIYFKESVITNVLQIQY